MELPQPHKDSIVFCSIFFVIALFLFYTHTYTQVIGNGCLFVEANKDGRARTRFGGEHSIVEFCFAELREVFLVVFRLDGVDQLLNLVFAGEHHGATTPACTGQACAGRAVLTGDLTDGVDLGAGAVIVGVARLLRSVHDGTQGRKGIRGRVLARGLKLNDTAGFRQNMLRALDQAEVIRLDREAGHVFFLEGLSRHARHLGHLVESITLAAGRVLGESSECGIEQTLEIVDRVALSLIGILEVCLADLLERVAGLVDPERLAEEEGGHLGLDDAEVVVARGSDKFVGGHEGVGDDKGHGRVDGRELDEGGFELGDELNGEGVLFLAKDGRALVHAARVDADVALCDDGDLGQFLLGQAEFIGLDDGQGGGTHEGGRRREAGAGGDGAVDEEIHALGLAQLVCPFQHTLVSTFEVV